MNRKQKKALYESIMKSVAKTVKHALNEDYSTDDAKIISDAVWNFMTYETFDFPNYTERKLIRDIKKGIITLDALGLSNYDINTVCKVIRQEFI